MPRKTSLGFLIGIFAGIFGFAMVWDMAIPAFVCGIAILVCIIVRVFNFNTDYYIKAKDVAETEEKYASEAK
jgi:cytochrome o ubiquinol oxidase subunit 1